jgi:Effector-associated domain 11
MRSDFFNDARTAILQGDILHALEIFFKNLNDRRFKRSLQSDISFKMKEWYRRYQKLGQLAQGGQDDGNELKRIQGEMLLLIQQLEREEIEHPPIPPMPQAGPTGIFEVIKSVVTAPLALVPTVKSAFTSTNIGKIVYESPSKMPLNHAESVTVRISQKSITEAILKEGLDTAKTKEGELEISDVMEVALFEVGGQQNFDIFPLNNAEQVLNKKSYTEWRFCLNAKRVGKFSMILRVSMKVHHPELGEKKKDIVTWSTSIEVDVDSEVQMEKVPIANIKWSNNFKKRLKEQIANNDFGCVFQDLANHLSVRDTELFNDLVVLQTRFNNLGNTQRLGVLSHQDYAIDFNRITGSLISLIDEVGSPRKIETLEPYKSEINTIKQACL